MNDSWIAIVDRTGLKQLVLETSHVLPFLMRRASHKDFECFWTVIEHSHARWIKHLIEMEQHELALKALNQVSTNAGTIPLASQHEHFLLQTRDFS